MIDANKIRLKFSSIFYSPCLRLPPNHNNPLSDLVFNWRRGNPYFTGYWPGSRPSGAADHQGEADMMKSRTPARGGKTQGKLPLLRRWRRDSRGATAIEFGIVAAPFFALMIAIIEVSLVYFANFNLENAVDQAGRLIRTGQAQQQGFSQGQFIQSICDNVSIMPGCASALQVDVKKFENFSGITLDEPLNGDGELRDDFGFDPGNGGDVVVVRAFYEWDLIAAVPGGLGNMANGSRLLVATTTFRNEPFDQ